MLYLQGGQFGLRLFEFLGAYTGSKQYRGGGWENDLFDIHYTWF
jgi:hypothetical protein